MMTPERLRERREIEGANRLIDHARQALNCNSDQRLCYILETTPSVISQIRRGKGKMGSAMLVRLSEALRMPVADLRRIMEGAPKEFDLLIE